MDFAGYAIGGLSVGEEPADMLRMLEATVPELPADRPRYLMGVGRPEDLLEAIGRGIDLFDCVMPTRNGRNAMAFTDEGSCGCGTHNTSGTIARCKRGALVRPAAAAGGISATCSWPARCSGPTLLSIHNLTYYQRLLADARWAIEADGSSSSGWGRCGGGGGGQPTHHSHPMMGWQARSPKSGVQLELRIFEQRVPSVIPLSPCRWSAKSLR